MLSGKFIKLVVNKYKFDDDVEDVEDESLSDDSDLEYLSVKSGIVFVEKVKLIKLKKVRWLNRVRQVNDFNFQEVLKVGSNFEWLFYQVKFINIVDVK